ncbi:MAG: hypothetical protein ABIQ31_13030 [Ferruginibacter sp.]
MPLLSNFGDTNKNVIIVGLAYNEKDGAWVTSKLDKKNYFLDGADGWDMKDVGKKVKVWGRLSIEELKEKPHHAGQPIEQQMLGIKRTILKAKWKFI